MSREISLKEVSKLNIDPFFRWTPKERNPDKNIYVISDGTMYLTEPSTLSDIRRQAREIISETKEIPTIINIKTGEKVPC